MIKVAIVGYGNIGKYAVDALRAAPASADKAFLQILFTDAQGFHPLLESGQFFRPYHNRSIAGC